MELQKEQKENIKRRNTKISKKKTEDFKLHQLVEAELSVALDDAVREVGAVRVSRDEDRVLQSELPPDGLLRGLKLV